MAAVLNATTGVRLPTKKPFQVSRCSCRARPVIAAAQRVEERGAAVERRSVLLAGAALLASPFVAADAMAGTIKIENLSGFQKRDQRAAFQLRVVDELKKVLSKDDASVAVRAVLHDAGTYDVATQTGGFNGSLCFELDRPENKSLAPYFSKLEKAKSAIDTKSKSTGVAPISWADLELMGLKVATKLRWTSIKVGRSSVQTGGETIADAFGAAWEVTLGRKDADGPDAEGRLLGADASPQEVREWFSKLGNEKPAGGFGAGKAPFWERFAYILWSESAEDPEGTSTTLAGDDAFAGWKKKYDRSKATVTRTEFEVDFIEQVTKLANLGADRNSLAYLQPMESTIRVQ